METVDVVIRLPKEQYNNILNKGQVIALSGYEKMIGKGTVLPKGHGKLVDIDEICKQVEMKGFLEQNEMHLVTIDRVKEALSIAETIIEADNAENNDKDGSK